MKKESFFYILMSRLLKIMLIFLVVSAYLPSVFSSVTVCKDTNYRNFCQTFTDSNPDFKSIKCCGGDFNDEASSIMVTNGWTATLCEDKNYGGFCQTFTDSNPDFTKIKCCGGNFNDEASSIKVSIPLCTILKAGCYNINNILVGFGQLAPSEFAYYQPADQCITGDCNCNGVPPYTATEQKDPDQSKEACGCITQSAWHTALNCCGDENEDCATQAEGQICSMNSEFKSSSVYSSKDAKGDIKYIGCTDEEFLADGTSWLPCDGTFTQTKVNGHDYLCKGKGKESIYECCGEGSCNSDTKDGVRLTTGQSIGVKLTGGAKIFYCASDKTFTTDLDVKDEITCKKAGFKWTGTKCCSEADDPNEYYNEPEGAMGCWNNETIISIDFVKDLSVSVSRTGSSDGERCNYVGRIKGNDKKRVIGKYSCSGFINIPSADWQATSSSELSPDSLGTVWNEVEGTEGMDPKWKGKWTRRQNTSIFDAVWTHPQFDNVTAVLEIKIENLINNSVINYKGEFHGCAIDKTNYNKNNDDLLKLIDQHTGDYLITKETNHDYCFNTLDNSYYCSYTEKWVATDGADRTHLSMAPIPNPKQMAECCAQKECWNGEICIANQRAKPTEPPIGDGFRCIDGYWTNSTLKFTPDGVPGYCPTETQCLINPFAENESSQCINSTQYFNDNYCENGKWATRTKLLALKLAEFINGDYTLFCDKKENTLNNLKYLIKSGEIAADALAKFQTKNFCVLSSGGKVIFAASLNKNLEDVPKSLSVFGVASCKDALIDDGEYHSCDLTNKAWYNKRLKSFIYSNQPINVLSDKNQMVAFDGFMDESINNIIDSIKKFVTMPPSDESYLNLSKKLDRLYVSQQQGKTIIGIIEGTNPQNAVIGYKNFDVNICSFVEQFNQAKKDADSGVLCANELKNYYVLAQGFQYTNLKPESIWQDLTSKLRIK